MFSVIKACIDAIGVDYTGATVEVRWPGKEEDKPDPTKHWIRVSTQTVHSRKVGFVAEGIGGRDQNKFEVAGLLFIQLFAPKKPGAYNDMKALADGFVRALQKYRSGTSDLHFVNVRPRQLNPESQFYRINVVAETEYTQLA